MDTGSSDNHSTTPYTIDWLHPLSSLYLRTFLGGWAPSLDHVVSDWGEIARVADCHSQEFYSSGQTHFSLRFTFNFSRFSMNLLTVPITRSAAFDVRTKIFASYAQLQNSSPRLFQFLVQFIQRYVSGQLSPRPLGHPTSLGLTKLCITFKPWNSTLSIFSQFLVCTDQWEGDLFELLDKQHAFFLKFLNPRLRVLNLVW